MNLLINRWTVVAAGALLQLCLGSVYAWSFFQKPMVERMGWTNAQCALTFSLAIVCLGLAAAAGGWMLPRVGPRRLAVSGVLLFAAGYGISAVALRMRCLWLMYAGYGVVGGTGLGLGYVTPVATVSKWFPERHKGLATGMVIMGFGFGALLMSKGLAPLLMARLDGNLAAVFGALGVLLGVPALLAAAALRNPPRPAAAPAAGVAREQNEPAAGVARPFVVLWLLFFCNIIAGIALIGFQSPLLQDLLHARRPGLNAAELAAAGATLIAVSSLFNGAGRMAWGAVSDRIGRTGAFRIMLGSQAVAFAGLALVRDPWVFCVLVCYVLLCYGGGFGTMPAFVADVFGPRRMAVLYGAILTAWSAAGLVGPQMVALLRDRIPDRAAVVAFSLSGVVLAAGCFLTWLGPARPRPGVPGTVAPRRGRA